MPSSSPQTHPLVVAILAGGLGKRLRPLVSDLPKSLASIGGEPFLFLLLRKLSFYGIKKVILLTGYMHDKVQAACGDGSAFNLELHYSHEQQPLGTAGALANAAAYLAQESEFILLNGDTYLDAPLSGFLDCKLGTKPYGRLAVIKTDDASRFGSVQVNTQGEIEAFREKDRQSAGLINAGIYKLSSKIFKRIPTGVPSSLECDIFPKLIEERGSLEAYQLEGFLHDIGTPESYQAFNAERMES